MRSLLVPAFLVVALSCSSSKKSTAPVVLPEGSSNDAVAAQADAAPALPAVASSSASEANPLPPSRPRLRFSFAWTPPGANPAAYEMPEPEDQHKVIVFADDVGDHRLPALIAMHGQPSRDKAPREYRFGPQVEATLEELDQEGKLRPVVLVLPVFRLWEGNWPAFDLLKFRRALESELSTRKIRITSYYAFGHSGAAGCGGDGLNRAHRLKPKAVGFFDTCLGPGWTQELKALNREQIPTIDIHSVETAGFRPRQSAEYQDSFDFGRAYQQVGLTPVECKPDPFPLPLREQPYRCAASSNGFIRAFVADTGKGQQGHDAAVTAGTRVFVEMFLARQGRAPVQGLPPLRSRGSLPSDLEKLEPNRGAVP